MITIKPLLRPLVVNGRLVYSEHVRARSIIRFKKRVIDHFPQLQSQQDWCYQLEHWIDYPATVERIKKAQENEEGVPILLFIYSTKKEGDHG